MRTNMKLQVLLALIGVAGFTQTLFATVREDVVYPGVVTNKWVGESGSNWGNAANWSQGSVPYIQNGVSLTNGEYVMFESPATIEVTNDDKAPNAAGGDVDGGLFANGIIVGENAGSVTINSGWWSTKLWLRRQDNRPTIINYSTETLVITIPIQITYGWNDPRINYNAIGVYPGVDYNRNFYARSEYSGGTDPFVFYDPATPEADSGKIKLDTSVFNANATFDNHPVVIETGHTVKVNGAGGSFYVGGRVENPKDVFNLVYSDTAKLSVTGRLEVVNNAELKVSGFADCIGEIVLKNARVTAAEMLPGATIIGTGTTTLEAVSGYTLAFSSDAADKIGFSPNFTESSGGAYIADSVLKIVKSSVSAAPEASNFKICDYSGITLKDGVSADEAFTFEIDDTSDAEYYIVTPKFKSLNDLASMTLTAAYAADDVGNMTNATRVVLAKSLFDEAPTAEDFEISKITGITPAVKPLLSVSVGEEGDNYVVTITPEKFVTMKGSNAYNSDWTATGLWNGEYSIEDGMHYLVQGAGHRLNSLLGAAEATFAGSSLTFTGNSSGTCWLGLKSGENHIGNVYLGAHGVISFNNGGFKDNKQFIDGKIYIGEDTDGAAAYIRASETHTYVVNSDISGYGELRISTDGGSHFPSIEINGDNSQYFGKLIFEYNGTEYVTNIIATANALGGNPAKEMDDGVRIDNTTLHVTDDVELTTTNRNFKFHHDARIEVDDGKTFMIPSKFKFDSSFNSFTKLGAGTLVVSGDNSAAEATVNVSEGALVAASARAVGRMTADVEEGAIATLPVVVLTAAEAASRGFAAKDWVFVPDGSMSNTPEENLALMTGRGWACPYNYGLEKWLTTLDQYAVDGGVMLTVSGKRAGLTIFVR